MASRPLVLVYQDLATPSVAPTTPDLNSVIVGPAYVLKDYPDDAAEILLSQAYGQLEAPSYGPGVYTPPTTGQTAVSIGSFPGNAPGAVIDRTSVKVYFQFPRVILASSYPITGAATMGTGATGYTSTGNENKITFVGISDIRTVGVQPGDRIVLTNQNGTGVGPQTFVGTVASVGEPNSAGTATDTTSLRLSANLPPNGTGAGQFAIGGSGTIEARVERTLSTQRYVDAGGTVVTFPDAGSDRLVIKGGVLLSVTVSGSVVTRPLSYAKIYLSYRALRQDLTAPNFVSNSDILIDAQGRSYFSSIGIIDARNPLAVGVWIALQNAGASKIYYLGVQADNADGHTVARAAVDTRRDLYAFAPLTQDLQTIGAYNIEWKTLGDPTIADRDGVPQKFRIVLGSVPLPTARLVGVESITGISQAPSSSSTTLRRTLTLKSSTTFDASNVLPGDQLIVGLTEPAGTWSGRRGVHTVAHVNKAGHDLPTTGDEAEIEVIPSSTRWNDTTAETATGAEFVIKSPTGQVKLSRLARVALMANATKGVLFSMLNPTVVGGPYRVQFTDVGASAITITVTGFDVTIGIQPTVTTTQQVVDAVNADAVLSSIMVAELVSTSFTIPSTIPYTALHVAYVQHTFVRTSVDAWRVTARNYRVDLQVTLDNSGGSGSGAVVTVSPGGLITVTYEDTVSTYQDIVDAINNTAASRAVVYAERIASDADETGTETTVAVATIAAVYSNIAISTNDDLFLWLFDSGAKFLTDGVKVGDTLEITIDPNNYAPGSFDGRLLSYPIAQVISENRIAISNLGDDTGSAAFELPHFYLRDFSGRYLDNETSTTAGAVHYRVRRALTRDDQVTSLITSSQSLKSKRATLCYPDLGDVTGLKDGSLPRVADTIRSAAASQPGWVFACQVAGALAGLPVQQGLTNLGFVGVSKIYNSSGFFREAQLTQISNGGLLVMHQRIPEELPFCIHQLTTDPGALETGELSVVKNVDFVSMYFQVIIEGFLGQYNVLPETLAEIQRAVIDGTERLKARRIGKIGAPLLSGEIQSIAVSSFAADRVVLYFKGEIPRPLNGVDFHLVI